MKKGISALILVGFVLGLLFQTVIAREIATETRVESRIVDSEGNVVDGSNPSVQYGVGQRTYYRDFDMKSGVDVWRPNLPRATAYRYQENEVGNNIIVERIYDEANDKGYYEEGSLYRKYRITYFPNSGIWYKQYSTGGDYYSYENLNMGFGLSKDLEVAYMETKVEFNSAGDNTIKNYIDTPGSIKADSNISAHGMNHSSPTSGYPGSANLRYVTGKENMRDYFFNYSAVGNMPLRMQFLASSKEDGEIRSLANKQTWFTGDINQYDTWNDAVNEGGEFSRNDIASAVKWQTGKDINNNTSFYAKYTVDLVVKVNNPKEVTDKFSGIVAGYSSWQGSWLVVGGQMNGFKKENRNAETIKVVYREHFNGLGTTEVRRRGVRFDRQPILQNELVSRNLVVLEKIPQLTDKKYTENTFAITTGTDRAGGIDLETYKSKLNFMPPQVSGFTMRNFGDKNYTMTATQGNDGVKTVNVDVYYDKDIVGGNKPGGGYEEKPAEDYVTVQYYARNDGKFKDNEITRYYVKKTAGKKIKDLEAPVIIPNPGYVFSHWSLMPGTDKVNDEMVIDRDLNLVANYFPEISTIPPPATIADKYAKMTFRSMDQGRFGDNTNPEVKTKDVWVYKDARKTVRQVRDAVGIDSLLVVTDKKYRHTGWNVPDATVVADNMVVDATYEEKKLNIPVKKTWTHTAEGEALPQSIELTLYGETSTGGTTKKDKLQTLTVKPDNSGVWQGQFKDVIYYDKYVLEEKTVPGYEMSYTKKGTAEAPTFEVINRKLPTLTIEKKVPGLFGDHQKAFQMKISLSKDGKAVSGSYDYTKGKETGKLTFSATGEATASLKHGETIAIKHLPADSDYVVQEDAQSAKGYTVSYTNERGRLDSDKKAEVTNTGANIVPTGIKGNAGGIGAMVGAVILAVVLVIGYVKLKERKRVE